MLLGAPGTKSNGNFALRTTPISKKESFQNRLLPPFQKSRNASPQSTVTRSLGSFFRMTMRRPISTKGLCRVSSARAHGRADETGPSLAWDVKEASAGNVRAQSIVPTF